MENPRNQLHDYLQKKHLDPPRYTAHRVGGSDHAPLWQAKVKIHDHTWHEGQVCSTKTLAHISASEAALCYLQQQQQQQQQPSSSPPPPPQIDSGESSRSVALLVDFENLPRLVRELSDEERAAVTKIYVFVGMHHHSVSVVLPEGVERVVVPSAQRDGTDCGMQVYVGCLLARRAYDEYLIATGDRFGAPLVEMIETTTLAWQGASARLITNLAQLREALK